MTLWLMLGGAASLLLPLMAVAYLRWSESHSTPPPSGRNDLFEHRDSSERKIVPSQSAAAVSYSPPPALPGSGERAAPASGSSLDFIRKGEDIPGEPPEQTAQAPAARAQNPAQAPTQQTASQTNNGSTQSGNAQSGQNQSKKSFSTPKLQPSSFTGFQSGGSSKKGGHGSQKGGQKGGGMPLQGNGQNAQGGGQDMQEMLKNLPPEAANNPEVKKALGGKR